MHKKIREKLKDKLSIILYATEVSLRCRWHPPDGANLYVIKPVSFEGLMDILKAVFSINWKEKFYCPPKEKFLFNLNG